MITVHPIQQHFYLSLRADNAIPITSEEVGACTLRWPARGAQLAHVRADIRLGARGRAELCPGVELRRGGNGDGDGVDKGGEAGEEEEGESGGDLHPEPRFWQYSGGYRWWDCVMEFWR